MSNKPRQELSRANFSGKLKGSTVALPAVMMANEKLKSFSPGVKSTDLKKGKMLEVESWRDFRLPLMNSQLNVFNS